MANFVKRSLKQILNFINGSQKKYISQIIARKTILSIGCRKKFTKFGKVSRKKIEFCETISRKRLQDMQSVAGKIVKSPAMTVEKYHKFHQRLRKK